MTVAPVTDDGLSVDPTDSVCRLVARHPDGSVAYEFWPARSTAALIAPALAARGLGVTITYTDLPDDPYIDLHYALEASDG